MQLTDMEIIAEVWVGDGETGGLERCIVDIERTDQDELRIGVRETGGEEPTTHVYLPRDRALRLAHSLIETALEPWRV